MIVNSWTTDENGTTFPTPEPVRRTVHFQGTEEYEFYRSAALKATVLYGQWIIESLTGLSTYSLAGTAVLRKVTPVGEAQ